MRVSLLVTCVVDLLDPDVGVSSVHLLRAAGCAVDVNLAQTCCGQPAWNAGFADDAARVATTTLEALEDDLARGAEAVVVPAGSCAAMVKVFWPELFEVVDRPDLAARARAVGERTFELSQFLSTRPPAFHERRTGEEDETPIAYHRSCHLLRELGVTDSPEALLSAAGCDLVEWDGADRCCGFGGMFSTKLPETSVAMADEKLESLRATSARVIVSADTSCLLHLRGRAEATGAGVQTRHLAQVLAERTTEQ